MSVDNQRRALIIFIKNPQPGKVKTRLAKDVGDQRAMEIYLQLLAHTRAISEKFSGTRLLFYSDWIAFDDEWKQSEYEKHLQHQGDLGERMIAAFGEAFRSHEKAIVIGSDCAELTTERIEEGFKALDRADVVIGPTLDGGYYLMGMKQVHSQLMDKIPWSSGRELMVTISQAISAQLSTVALPELSDIDYLEDWEQYGLEK